MGLSATRRYVGLRTSEGRNPLPQELQVRYQVVETRPAPTLPQDRHTAPRDCHPQNPRCSELFRPRIAVPQTTASHAHSSIPRDRGWRGGGGLPKGSKELGPEAGLFWREITASLWCLADASEEGSRAAPLTRTDYGRGDGLRKSNSGQGLSGWARMQGETQSS